MSKSSSGALSTTLTLVGLAGLAGLTYAVWRFGASGPLPLHFNWEGHADRFGDRMQLVRLIGGMAAAGAAFSLLLVWMERLRDNAGWRDTLRLARNLVILALLFAAVTLGSLAMGSPAMGGNWGGPDRQLRITLAGMGLLFAIIGAVIGKVRPNPFAGVRTYWSLTSRLAWDKSNRLAGRLFLLVGAAALLAAPWAPMPLAMQLTVGAVLLSAVASVYESFRVWRTDPDRKPRKARA